MIMTMVLTTFAGCINKKEEEEEKEETPSYPNDVSSNLQEGIDYIDHATTYDGSKLEYNTDMWYVNNLKDVPLPDPQVYFEDDTYYIVGTSDRDNGVIDCYTTKDFVTYVRHTAIYNPANFDGWEGEKPAIYAPELYCFDGVYYMYYSAKDKNNIRRNSVVVAENPWGPYKPLQNNKVDGLKEPVFLDKNTSFDVLDITIFVDDDEQMYMYYSVACNENQHIVGVKMNSPYEADWSTYTKIVEPGALNSTNNILKPLSWEMFRDGLPIVEAPYVIKSGGKYYMTYSVNGCWDKFYNVCYAISDSPLGNFEKPYQNGGVWTNLLLGYPGTNIGNSTVNNQWAGFASGTGHHCFFNVGDQVMIGYHAHQDRDGNGRYEKRYFAFDYLHFDQNGVPFCNGPTYSVQPLPEALSGYSNIAPFAEVKSQNVTNAGAINDNYIVDCYNLAGEAEKEVTLGEGFSFIELKFDATYEIGGIAIYNSAFYEKLLSEIVYIDFGNGNVIKYPQFPHEQYVNDGKEFIFPNSAFTIEMLNKFKADHVVICVNASAVLALNEIVVLGRKAENNDNVSDEDNKVHLIVLAGQSGARGKALVNDLSAEDKVPNADVDIIADGLPMGELGNIPGIEDYNYIDILESGYGDFPSEFGPELGMGQTMASAYPKFDAEYKSVIVKYTASGSTFTDHWYSTSALNDSSISSYLNLDQVNETAKGAQTGPLTNNLYQLVEKAIDELNDLGYDVVIDGMAFVHGEQDAKFDDNMAIYEKALTYFINDFRAYFEDSDMPVVVTEALTNSAKYSNTLREIQANVCKNLRNVSLIKTSDLYTNTFEPWHFGAKSNMILGNRIAAEIISNNETRVIKSIDEEVINVPKGVKVDLPQYVKATFTNYYTGYVKVEAYSDYDCNQLGAQNVQFTVKTAEGIKEFSLKINVSDKVAFVDGNLNEYGDAKKNLLPNDLGEVYVIKGENGLYIAANIKDNEIFTDGENWHRGDMGQKGNNDDFIIYLTNSDASNRTTICLSSANLLRVYGKGLSLSSADIQLELGNLVYNKKIFDYQYHVTTNGLTNGGESNGMTLELYISYEDLGITNPNDIKLCFNYSNVTANVVAPQETRIIIDNYLVNGTANDKAEENIDSYFSINDLIQ